MSIRRALDAAGYTDEPDTPEALKECFLDYVAAGSWGDLDLEEALEALQIGEIGERDMIRALGG